MDLSEIQEIWEPYMEQCVNNPAEGFESVNLTFIGTGDQKCEEFFNYDKYVIFSTRAKLWLNQTYTFGVRLITQMESFHKHSHVKI